MEIPKQLENFNFVLIGGDGKQPIEKGWQKKIHKIDCPIFQKNIQDGKNYGVQGNNSQVVINDETYFLVIIDFDKREFQDKVINLFPETFTTTSGSKKNCVHLWFASDNNKSFKIKDENLDTLADIIGAGKQVIAPRSKHNSGSVYSVVKDIPFAFIPYAEIEALLKPHDKSPKKILKPQKQYSPKGIDTNTISKIINSISMEEALKEVGIDTSKNPTNCFGHSSNGGKCLGWNNKTAHCFHCDKSWNKYSLIREAKNLTDKETFEWFANKAGMTNELEKSRKDFIIKNIDYKETERIVLTTKFSPVPYAEKILNNNYFVYDKYKRFWFYNKEEGYWDNGAEQKIRTELRKNLIGEEQQKKYYIDEIIAYMKDITFDDKFSLEVDSHIIPFNNCLFNLRIGKIEDFNQKYFVTTKIPIDLDSKYINCDVIDSFFEDCVGKDYKEMLYDLCSYCLFRGQPYQKLFFIFGTGQNGKSVFLELLRKFLGENNVSSVSPHDIDKDKHASSTMDGKLANISSDISYESLSNVNRLKELTGEDTIFVRPLYQQGFPVKIYAKQIFSTNQLPIVSDKTFAWYRRLYLIEFPNIVDNKHKDPFLLEKLTTKEQLMGLAWICIKKLSELYNRKFIFTFDPLIDKIAEFYEDLSNPISKFIKEYTLEGDGFIFKYDLRSRFELWCKNNKLRVWTDTEIGNYMKKEFEDGKRSTNVGIISKQYMAWIGLRWKESGENIVTIQGRQTIHGFTNISILYTSLLKPMDSMDSMDSSKEK